MNTARWQQISSHYARLRVAVLGDYCLDRYLEIDPQLAEVSIETGLPVHNVVHVRAQPGGAGTILNNLTALGVGRIMPIGFCGDDGEGYELRRSLAALPGVAADLMFTTPLRRTFTYCKPLVMQPAGPVELNRLDSKNWTATPAEVEDALVARLQSVSAELDALIVLDQVDRAETGAVTTRVLAAIAELSRRRPELLILADSRRGLRGYPPLGFKMNRAELCAFMQVAQSPELGQIERLASELAVRHGRPVIVTLAEDGIIGAMPSGEIERRPSLTVRGPIDVVGAGDCVTANLTTALAAGARLGEVLEIANVAASIVLHKVGTTGTASIDEIAALL